MAEIGFGDEKGVWSKMCCLQENRVLVEKTGLGGENYVWDEKMFCEENRLRRRRCAPPG